MTWPIKERALSTAVVIPTAVVVIVLAVLQYRWSNQVSEATSVRLADSLQMSMINWHLDFFRYFSEMCLTMRVDPESGTPGDLNQYMRRFAEWRAVAKYPELVSNLYLLKSDEAAHPRALRLDPSTRRFEPEEWPAPLERLRSELRQASLNFAPAAADSAFAGKSPGLRLPGESQKFTDSFFYIGDPLAGWRFEPNIPALLHPIVPDGAASNRNAVDWIVIELNRKVIQAQILPDLAQAYFRGTDGLDFQVAVVSGSKPGHLIYSSDPDFGKQEVVDADGTMDLFGRIRDKALGSPIHIFHTPSESRGPATSVGISWFPLLQETPQDQDWQLVVRHRRGGPLGAFVAEMRRRDLAISFGVLLLLVISMGMLIIASNRAHRLAKLQMDFVTAVSHELRTPLTVISSAADNIAHGVVEGKEQLTQYGSVIGGQARQLSGLVEEILLFAATRQGQQRYDLRPLQIPQIIDAALASTAGLVQAAQFTVERESEPNLPPVMGDLLALSQCLQNLITNALKYASEQRWIGIRARISEQGVSGKEIQVSISDRGIGIGAADLPHIFEPFYRSPSAAAAQIHGTGLGLPLAKSIAEAMKGHLTVTSEPGRGSTFTLHLPFSEQSLRRSEVEESATGVLQ